ncbi:squalene synthase HpnD [Bradyrhizobium sp. USDA 4529]
MSVEAAANASYGSTASGSSFYAAMRILPRAQREAMFQIYSFCRQVDDIADSDGPRPERLAALQQWRDDIDALYAGHPPERLKDYVASVKTFGLKREDFVAIVDGMEMDVPQDIRAPDLATLDLYCDRVASAVGRLSVRVFGLPEDDGIQLAYHLGRALQLTNILRDIDEDAGLGRLYLPREWLWHAGITNNDPARVTADRALPKVCAPLAERAKMHFQKSDEIMKRNSRRAVRAPRIMSKYYRAILDLLIARGFTAPRAPVRVSKRRQDRHPSSLRDHLMQKTVHIIGAGISGLSAAVRLANGGYKVFVHEATQQAGGRCRSYFDAATNLTIDNGNHLLLSGNRHALSYARAIGTEAGLVGPARAQFPFVDLASGRRWQLDLGDSRLPLWVFDEARRVPDTSLRDYLALAPLAWAGTGALVGNTIPCKGTLYDRLVQPLLLAALNVDPPEGSAGLAGAIVRETLLAGGQACRPLIARDGLSSVLIEPAVKLLQERGHSVQFSHELRALGMSGDRISELDFGNGDKVALGADDAVVLAVPPRAAAALLPGLKTPTKFRAIVNAHFRVDPPRDAAPILGVVGGLVEWLFAFPQRLSVTISNGDRLVDMPREELALAIWQDICEASGVSGDLPPWQIVRERRATFEATPEQNALRPGPATAQKNLFLAGDWTATGLPATIEGSVRSGDRAADLVLARR